MKLELCNSAEPAGKKRKSRHAHRCGILPRHSAERRIASKRICAGEGKARVRDDAINPESQRIENLRTECMRFVHAEELASRIVTRPLVVQFVRLSNSSAVVHIRSGKAVLCRKFVIDLDREIVFRRYLLTRKRINPRIACSQHAFVG